MNALTLNISELGTLTDERLYRLCAANPEMRIERTSRGELVVMTPSGGETSRRNGLLVAALVEWNEEGRTGIVFDSNGGFLLPRGAMRAPDAAWVAKERWEQLSAAEREKFPPLCPDFMVELRSPTDWLPRAQAKMEEWMENGCRLGWLIDPQDERAYVYRADGTRDVVASFDGVLNGENVLAGFTLSLARLR